MALPLPRIMPFLTLLHSYHSGQGFLVTQPGKPGTLGSCILQGSSGQFAWLCSQAALPHIPKQRAGAAVDAAGGDSAQHLDAASETRASSTQLVMAVVVTRFVITLGGGGERGKKGALMWAEILKGLSTAKPWSCSQHRIISSVNLLRQRCNLHLDAFHSLSMFISSCPALSCLLGNN